MIRSDAPPKPDRGAPCNGCGLCCLHAPCPLGVWVSRRRHGRCAALRWDDNSHLYRCGVLTAPREHLPWLPEGLTRTLARRWIAAGEGCDADLQAEPAHHP